MSLRGSGLPYFGEADSSLRLKSSQSLQPCIGKLTSGRCSRRAGFRSVASEPRSACAAGARFRWRIEPPQLLVIYLISPPAHGVAAAAVTRAAGTTDRTLTECITMSPPDPGTPESPPRRGSSQIGLSSSRAQSSARVDAASISTVGCRSRACTVRAILPYVTSIRANDTTIGGRERVRPARRSAGHT